MSQNNQRGVKIGPVAILYITKWVLTRGIVVAQGTPLKISSRQHRELYEVQLKGHRWTTNLMTIGHDAFLTLEEALEYTKNQFEKQVQDCRAALEAALEAQDLFEKGLLEIHQDPERIRDVYAFGRPLLPRG